MHKIIYRVIRMEGFIETDGHVYGGGEVIFVSTNRRKTKATLEKLKRQDFCCGGGEGTKTLTHVMDEVDLWEANIHLVYAY